MLLKRRALLRLHIDHEAVGCIGRRGVAPAGNQIGAQQHQQHQRHQAHSQGADLHHRISGARAELARGHDERAWRGGLVHAGPQQPHRAVTCQRKQPHRSSKATDRNRAQQQVSAGGQQQGREPQHAQTQHRQRGWLELTHIAPNHTQRRHLRELQHRWQTKSQHQSEPHAQTQQHRRDAGRGQAGLHQPGQQHHKHMVHRVADGDTQRAGHQADQRELQRVGARHRALRQAEHPQHGAVVQMALGKTARRNRDRHRTQQRRQQCHQVQKFLSPLQRLLHFGPPALQRFQPHAAHTWLFDLCLSPAGELRHRRVVASHRQAVVQPACGLHQASGWQIGGVDHDARGKAHEACAPIGLHHNDSA